MSESLFKGKNKKEMLANIKKDDEPKPRRQVTAISLRKMMKKNSKKEYITYE